MINSNNNKALKKGTKQHHISLLLANGHRLSCLDQKKTGDTCLHSTISSLTKYFDLEIPRIRKKLPNSRNKLVSVTQYYFNDRDKVIMAGLL